MKKYCFFFSPSLLLFGSVQVKRKRDSERALRKGFYGPLVDDLLGILNLVHKLCRREEAERSLEPINQLMFA